MSTVRGIPDLKAALSSIPEKLRRRALRNALAAGARVVRDAAKARVPVMSAEAARRAPYRTPGLVKKSIVVRTSKSARRAGDVGVFVNVRPAKSGQRGAKSKTDPFYWRWLNFGWTPAGRKRGRAGINARRRARAAGRSSAVSGVQFLEAGAAKLEQALQVFISKIGPQIQKLNGGKGVQL